MSMKNEFSNEIKKLKQMSFQDKIWYLWSYYKVDLAGFLAAVVILSVAANAVYRTTFTTRLGIALVNNHSQNLQTPDLLEEQLRQILGCGKKDLVEVNSGLYLGERAAGEDSYLAQTKLAALIASDALDILIADQAAIELYSSADALCDLSSLLPQELSSLPPDAFSLSVEGTWLTEKGYISSDAAYLAVISTSPRKEAAVQVIRSLFS